MRAVLSDVPSQSAMLNCGTSGFACQMSVHGVRSRRKTTVEPLFGHVLLSATQSFGVAMMLKLATFLPTSVMPGGLAVARLDPSAATATRSTDSTASVAA